MKPYEAGFDGTINLNLPSISDGGFLNLSKGSDRNKPPWSVVDVDFKNQLLWWDLGEGERHLFYCNHKNEWFELSFHPISGENGYSTND